MPQAAECKHFADVENVEERQLQVRALQEALDRAKERGRLINSREALFGWPVTQYDQIRQVQKDLQPYVDLWTAAAEFSLALPVYMDGSFIELDPQVRPPPISDRLAPPAALSARRPSAGRPCRTSRTRWRRGPVA